MDTRIIDNEEIVKDFLIESNENLTRLDQEMVELEQNPSNIGLLASVFRTIHTIKGTCMFFGFYKLESLTHVGENLLSRLRDSELRLTPEITSALLAMVDAIRQILLSIEIEGKETQTDFTDLVQLLTNLNEKEEILQEKIDSDIKDDCANVLLENEDLENTNKNLEVNKIEPEILDKPKVIEDVLQENIEAVKTIENTEHTKNIETVSAENYILNSGTVKDPAKGGNLTGYLQAFGVVTNEKVDESSDKINDSITKIESQKFTEATQVFPSDRKTKKVEAPIFNTADLIVIEKTKQGIAEAQTISESTDLQRTQTEPHTQTQTFSDGNLRGTQSLSDNNIRVDVSLLDKLMNLVGELVLARNQILQFTTTQQDSAFIATSQRLNLITSELQESVMKTRMQPIANIWSKFPRMVRDLALMCSKQVYIEMEGKETELDKTIIEAIKDPLTHILRNSIDHGIELPEIRLKAGKPAEGHLFLRASHEGGQVNIEISDDGAGINSEKVKQKALQRGLISPEEASFISEREATNLIFLPGFSTSEKVTNVSGRGVGMDVVKTNIEKIGGLVDVQSKFGKGTTLKIKIPLTLAIIPALIVTSSGERYAIPQVNLLELVRLDSDSKNPRIEMIHGTPVYRLRGNILPLAYLDRELMVNNENSSKGSSSINIVVLQADDRSFGLVVDEINDTEEIVVKPLGKQLKGISCFAGATIMGDGKVALILDVLGIAQRANVISEIRDRSLTDKVSKSQQFSENSANLQTLLLFKVGKTGRIVMPLSAVARLEEFPLSNIEITGEEEVVQYRNQILKLIRLSNILYKNAPQVESDQDVVQVVVYSENGRSVGFIVENILDIVEENLTIQHRSCRQGILGSAIIQQHVTDILDVYGVIRCVDPTFFE